MRICKDSLVLRTASKADCAQLAHWWNDGAVMAHAGFYAGIHTTEKDVWEQMQKEAPQKQRFMMELEGKPIGEMCYCSIDAQTAEIGIKICVSEKQNHGLGKLFLKMMITYLFTRYEVIIATTMQENTRAQHVYEQLGFHYIGKEEGFIDSHGQPRIGYRYQCRKA